MVLASVLTVSACLFILGIVFCIVANVRSFTDNLDSSLGVIAFLDEGTTDEAAKALAEQIRAMDNVKEVNYVSADQAWTDFKSMMGFESQFGEDTITKLDEDNPLADSASLQVYLEDASGQGDLVAKLEKIPQVRRVRYSAETADVLSSLSQMVTVVGFSLILLLVLIAILLISNTIKLSVFVRRKEIGIMKYIGATNSFVKIPFIVEGVIIGVFGAIIPSVILYFSYAAVLNILVSQFTFTNLFNFIDVNTIIFQLIPLFLGVGILVGILGSAFSLQKYLRV